MNRKQFLTLVISVVITILIVGTQLGCEGEPKKEAEEATEKAEKTPAEAKTAPGEMETMPFGGKEDTEFASMVWTAMKDYQKWLVQSDMVPGKSPHGAFVQVYFNVVSVDEKPYHVIVKDNFMPDKKLAAVTVMAQREAGYDSDNNNWFWAKYDPDGSISKNDKDMALAGRVAKGMDMGCIACHKAASDKDYVFINDAGTYGQ